MGTVKWNVKKLVKTIRSAITLRYQQKASATCLDFVALNQGQDGQDIKEVEIIIRKEANFVNFS